MYEPLKAGLAKMIMIICGIIKKNHYTQQTQRIWRNNLDRLTKRTERAQRKPKGLPDRGRSSEYENTNQV